MARRIGFFWLILMTLVYAAVVVASNTDTTLFTFPGGGGIRVLISVAMILSFAFGATIVSAFFLFNDFRKTMEIRSLRKKNQKLRDSLQYSGSGSPSALNASKRGKFKLFGRDASTSGPPQIFDPEAEADEGRSRP